MDSEDPFCRRSDRSELSVEKGKRGRARKEKGLKTQGDGTLGGGRIGGGELGGTDGKEQTPI